MSRHSFRVVVPTNVEKLLLLGERILLKHYQDGSASPIPVHLIDQLQQLVAIARLEHDRQNDFTRQKEKRNEERNTILGILRPQNAHTPGTVRYYLTATRDILLGHFRSNERALGDWGFTVNSPKGAVQIVLPTTADGWITLAKLVLKKHYEDGAGSLLNNLNLDQLQTVLYEVEQKFQEGQALNREKEKATQLRNIALGLDKGQSSKTPNTVKYIVRAIRDLLLGTFRGREQELGAWGFEVNFNTISEGGKV